MDSYKASKVSSWEIITPALKFMVCFFNLWSNPSETIWEWKEELIPTYIFSCSCILSTYIFYFQV